ncbi:MAG: TetR/AcrR family transcriptional regulator [Vicinamibacterales bacterium]
MGRTSDAKARLVAAMADLVHRRGYLGVGVDEVCKAAGVKKGSFYHFFPSKRDLMLAALDQHWQMGRDHVIDAAFNDHLPPLERIERFFAVVAGLEAANRDSRGHVLGCPFGNIAAEVGTSDPALTKRADEAFWGFAGFVRDALSDAKTRGDLERTVDVNEAADAVVAYFEGLALLAKTRNDPSLILRLGARAVQLATRPPHRAARRRRKTVKRRS